MEVHVDGFSAHRKPRITVDEHIMYVDYLIVQPWNIKVANYNHIGSERNRSYYTTRGKYL